MEKGGHASRKVRNKPLLPVKNTAHVKPAAPAKRKPVVAAHARARVGKAGKEMEFLKTSAKTFNVQTPEGWPKDTVPNVRAFGPLPEGWHHAKKVTKASGRGSGGLLRNCLVGPGGKLFWHKYDLEKFLGVQIDQPPKDVRRPRVLSMEVSELFPRDAILKRTSKGASEPYISKRCDALDGYAVHDALEKFEYECHGDMYQYNVSDLRYDIKGGRLTLLVNGVEKKMESGHKKPVATSRVKESPPPKSASRSKRAAKVPVKQPVARKGKVKTAPAKKTDDVADCSTKLGKLQLRQTSRNDVSCKESAIAGLKAVSSAFGPLKKRAALGDKDELSIYTLLGFGHAHKIDSTLLSVLPDILRKKPADRSEFGETVLKQFEREIRLHS